MAASNTEDSVRKRMLTGCTMFAPVLEALDIVVYRFFFFLKNCPLDRAFNKAGLCSKFLDLLLTVYHLKRPLKPCSLYGWLPLLLAQAH